MVWCGVVRCGVSYPSYPTYTQPTNTPNNHHPTNLQQAADPIASPTNPQLAEPEGTPVPERLRLPRDGPHGHMPLLINRLIGAVYGEEALASVCPDHLDRGVARYQVRVWVWVWVVNSLSWFQGRFERIEDQERPTIHPT